MVGLPRIRRALLWGLVLLGAGAARADTAGGVRIAVLKSQGTAPYQETLAGFKELFSRQALPVSWMIYELDGEEGKAAQAVERIRNGGPCDLVLALGTLATETAVTGLPHLPVVSGMVMRKEALRAAPNATAVILGFPVETHLDWLQRFLPNAKTIGILYNPAENGERVALVAEAARQRGLRLETEKVEAPRDLPPALERLSRTTEALWGIPDEMVLNGRTARQILLACFRSRIPFIGVSASWTKAGALYSLDRDYRDMGEQCAQAAIRILHGTPASRIPAAPPRRVLYSLNLRTADYLGLTIPAPLLGGAAQVFEAEPHD